MSSAGTTPGTGAARTKAHRTRAKAQSGAQLTLAFPRTWGGSRPGAGRKRALRGNVPHQARPRHRAAEPVLVTLRARLAPLRSQFLFPTVRLALLRAARRDPGAFRLLHFSAQGNHLHLIVEARDRRSLSRGVQSIAIRIARYLNDLLMRHGALWADRWHGRALKTPREVRHALVYVLANFRKHLQAARTGIDPYASGEWFDGWRDWTPHSGIAPPWAEVAARAIRHEESTPVVVPARTWLARIGWRRHGLVRFDEQPASPRPGRPRPT